MIFDRLQKSHQFRGSCITYVYDVNLTCVASPFKYLFERDAQYIEHVHRSYFIDWFSFRKKLNKKTLHF